MKVAPSKIAEVDARRMAQVMREVGGGGEAINSGWMVYDGPGSWATYAAGLGLSGPVTSTEIQRLIDFYDAHGVDAQIQTTPYQDPSLFRSLSEHDFVPDDFTIMLVHDLEEIPKPRLPGLKFVKVDPRNDAHIRTFVETQEIGFYGPALAPPGIDAITERVARHPRCRLWILKLDGQIVGSGGLEVFEDNAVLIAGAVDPDARQQGIQSAFISYRLQIARKLGLSYALVGSVPNGGTERNALRHSFVPVMTQVFLRRRLGPKAKP